MTTSVFAKYIPQAYPHQFEAKILLDKICGGIPSDPKVAEGWLKSKFADKDDLIRDMVAEVMAERGINAEEAAEVVDIRKHLNGFKRTPDGELYIEGRQVKAMLKESANIRWPYPTVVWGPNGRRKAASEKGQGRGKLSSSFFAEHVFIQEDAIGLGVKQPTDVLQRFPQTWRGSAIQYEEYVDGCEISFTVTSDYNFTEEEWALVWLTAEQNGLGATRSQGYGRFKVTQWKRVKGGKA